MEFLLCLQTLAVTDDTVLEEHHEDPCLIQMRLLDDGGEFFFSFIDWTGISWRLLLMKSTIYRYIIEVASVAIVILMSNSLIDRGGISMISGRMLWMTNTYIYRGGFSGTLLLITSTLKCIRGRLLLMTSIFIDTLLLMERRFIWWWQLWKVAFDDGMQCSWFMINKKSSNV